MVVYGVWPYQMGLLGAINACTIEIFPDYTLSLLSLVNLLLSSELVWCVLFTSLR